MPRERLTALLAYVSSDDRVCPEPNAWMRLHRLLGEVAPRPLILAGWYGPWWAKRRQLEAQIRFAADHGRLERVDRFLRRLPEREWYVEPEAVRRLAPEPLLFRMLEEPRKVPAPRPKGSRQLSLRFRYARSRSTL